jgi:hypothetical protein
MSIEILRITWMSSPVNPVLGHRAETDELVTRVHAEAAEAVCSKPFDDPEPVRTVERLAAARADQSGESSG